MKTLIYSTDRVKSTRPKRRRIGEGTRDTDRLKRSLSSWELIKMDIRVGRAAI